jgi:hypothetical protein
MSRFAIEEEAGTYTGTFRAHNGYWAGDFSSATNAEYLPAWFAWGRSQGESWNSHPNNRPATGSPHTER